MVAISTQPPARPPALLEAAKRSTVSWQEDLQVLFHRAKDRFPDVVWDLIDENAMDDGDNTATDEIWGHKAIVYARAPPTFQARYFSFRPPPISSPLPFAASPTPSLPMPQTSALSLNLGIESPYPASIRSTSPSHFRPISPASSTIGSLTHISLNHNPALFSDELEYLYTGKGFGDAFEFLFDANEKGPEGDVDAEGARVEKLRKDLVFMWRSRLYSDVRIELHSDVPSMDSPANENEEETRPIFCSHRFILVSRSPYFYDQLITYGVKNAHPPGEPATIRIPSPPFTAPAFHFTLGYLYTGTVSFSNRTYDLDTAFAILCSANYLQLQTLYDEVQARLVQEMLHGLFHAFLEFAEYERITGGRWGTGGCRCRQCARRAPRTLIFSVRPDVQNTYLERGARRALVGLFGEGWCNSDFAALPQKTKDGLMAGLKRRVISQNVFPLLFAAHVALAKLLNVRDPWAQEVRDMVLTARGFIDKVLCDEAEKCFDEREWVDIMENDGMGRFEDGERVEWTMEAIKRGVSESNAGTLYQTLVSSILLRPHQTETGQTLLSSFSQIRVQVEETKSYIIKKWLGRRWAGVRNEGGFDHLESWAIKEISDEINIPVEDLLTPSAAHSGPVRGPLTRAGLRPTLSRVEDATERETVSTQHSLRTSVLNKNMTRGNAPVASSSASVRSAARSVVSTNSRVSSRLTTATERERKESRPDSKFAPSTQRSVSPNIQRAPSALSTTSSMDVDGEGDETERPRPRMKSPTPARTTGTSSIASRRAGAAAAAARPPHARTRDAGDGASVLSVNQSNVVSVKRPVSSAASVTSTRSHASTIRRNTNAAAPAGQHGTLRPTPQPARPTSSLSTASVSSTRSAASTRETTLKTRRDISARNVVPRTRTISTTSTTSVRSTATTSKSPKPPVPALPKGRPRRASEASVASLGTGAAASRAASARKVSPSASASTTSSTRTPANNKAPTIRKSPSASSIRSTASGATAGKKTAAKKSLATDEKKTATTPTRQTTRTNKPLPKAPSKENVDPAEAEEPPNSASTLTIKKGKSRAESIVADDRSRRSSDNASVTTRATLRRRGSNDTITTLKRRHPGKTESAGETITVQPKGATLDIGIPCIITSKRKRFRAFARYIGEVEGELGPWVGVEVPISDAWVDDQSDSRQWNDGTWGGIRYFDVGSMASEWGDDERMTRRRRELTNGYGSSFGSTWRGTKREGEQLSVDRKKRFRSASPSVSDVSNAEYRGLFVRPQQVLYVVDAVGSD